MATSDAFGEQVLNVGFRHRLGLYGFIWLFQKGMQDNGKRTRGQIFLLGNGKETKPREIVLLRWFELVALFEAALFLAVVWIWK